MISIDVTKVKPTLTVSTNVQVWLDTISKPVDVNSKILINENGTKGKVLKSQILQKHHQISSVSTSESKFVFIFTIEKVKQTHFLRSTFLI